jgi:DNA uptake protein ComE-like DNA-binding protein
MKNQINFNLSKRNRRAVILLSFILLFIIYIPRIYYFFKNEDKISLNSFPSKKWEYENRKSTNYHKKEFYTFKDKKKRVYNRPISKFDPNLYSKSDWMKLGLSIKQAEVVFNFSKRGLSSNVDLKKIFVISSELFDLIKDSTYYPIKNKQKFETPQKIEKAFELIEINSANEDQLLSIKGIGPFYAKQILKRRNELGGFYQKSQLLEVWKMDQERFEIIKDFITVDNLKIIKIDLNSVKLEELKIHPYFRWNIANSLIKMREQKNGFKNLNEIKESVLINEELFEKLKPYLYL